MEVKKKKVKSWGSRCIVQTDNVNFTVMGVWNMLLPVFVLFNSDVNLIPSDSDSSETEQNV